MILYSDDDWGKDVIRIKSPEFLKGATFDDGPHRGKPNPFAIHNALFLAGLKMCKEHGATHACYVEQDCRVGRPGWDDVIFDEYFNLGRPCIVAGTCSVYNPASPGIDGLRRFYKHFSTPPKHGIPTAAFGWLGASTLGPSCIVPNGALAVYDMAWITGMFDVERQADMATQNTAYDLAIGTKIWDLFSEDAYDVIGSLGSIYSGYANIVTSEEVRRELLTSGKVVAYHQEKTNYIPKP